MKYRLQNTSRFSRSRATRRGGFTLIELMVVLAIAAVVTSLTVGGYREMSDGNKRTSCQTNLTQIYQGLRLYANDEAGQYPPYQYDSAATPKNKGIGLWTLYTYPKDGSTNDSEIADVGVKPVARYIRNPKVFHCPADAATDNRENLYADAAKTKFNPNFLSYQRIEDDDEDLYVPWRQKDNTKKVDTATEPGWKRQLALWVPDGSDADSDPDIIAGAQPSDDTVVTWCMSHRDVRDYDNVLFLDGSVQLLPNIQDDAVLANCANDPLDQRKGASRLPKRDHCS